MHPKLKEVSWNVPYWIKLFIYESAANEIEAVKKALTEAEVEFQFKETSLKTSFKIKADVRTAGMIYDLIDKAC